MKQEDKELLLKDLCSRLCYELVVQFDNDQYSVKGIEQNGKGEFFVSVDVYDSNHLYIGEVKPYLRSLSSMTRKEKFEYEGIVIQCFDGTIYSTIEPFDYLNAHHFDYRGLIEKGLAIEVTEENNPYK